ncbi:phenylacetate-CoA oxygenase subunit PaaC [Calidifontibacter sp. DB0510]|uniref:Phenylacetate-CoA oxygenase subunit PaaC n=1 Tax=Metallococcus carri TaxID=1656884 RepID=A0A967B0S8_9MICO|nr:1,2-phenylacetyl-CoA epoxidase subunit PaaC [Metallococcus carri]NHN55929.1 phenylacetate-CoA oxygenase subunit PaaC [Metallococcus carri]NOP38383.1 phenylacetate-CoA oxygenase subunit PaaC [Calidifontibacter sp. DB2511S]
MDKTIAPADVTATYLLGLADDALIYTQRLGEWMSRAPQIEEDMALGNIALDLLGQARALLTRVGELDGTGRDEDALAYLRDEREFRNVHLVERPRGDFGDEMARLLWFSSYQFELYSQLTSSTDEVLAGVAAKAIKEVTYHRDHATQWVLRLGDGTPESHARMQAALDRVAPYVDELFTDTATDEAATTSGVGVLPSQLRSAATAYVRSVVDEATLAMPAEPRRRARGGRDGIHSQAMGYLLAEMQHIHRSHPDATTW